MHFQTAVQCCHEIEDLILVAEPPSRDALLRLMVVEKRLRLEFCGDQARARLRSLINAIERLWTVGLFPPVAGESTMLQASALRELESLRRELAAGSEAGSANDNLLAA